MRKRLHTNTVTNNTKIQISQSKLQTAISFEVIINFSSEQNLMGGGLLKWKRVPFLTINEKGNL